MVRRRQRPKYDTTLPAGWRAHNGGHCPVEPDSRPAIMFRYGAQMRPGTFRASYFFGWACGNLWEWSGSSHDIIAYRPEGEFPDEDRGPPVGF